MGIFSSIFGGGSSPMIRPQYTGARPPEPLFLRPVERQITDILMRRSQGEDVGYDPERRKALQENLERTLGRRERDLVRSAQGRRSAAGLSGNLAAGEEMEGRVQEDISSDLATGLTDITIEDLARANQERDLNTERLRQLNRFNFGQANKVADFDFGIFGAETGNEYRNAISALRDRTRQDDLDTSRFEGIADVLGNIDFSQIMGGPSQNALAQRQIGTGIGDGSRITSTYGGQPAYGVRRSKPIPISGRPLDRK